MMPSPSLPEPARRLSLPRLFLTGPAHRASAGQILPMPGAEPDSSHQGSSAAEDALAAAVSRISGIRSLRRPHPAHETEPCRGSEPEADATTWLENRAEQLCDANGIRRRRLKLAEDWWQKDCGPLLGISPELGPLALEPRAFGGYVYVGADGRRRNLDQETARGLGRRAIALYPPIRSAGPESSAVRTSDLLRSSLRGLSADLALIVALSLSCGLLALITPFATEALFDALTHPGAGSSWWLWTAGLGVAAVAIALLQLTRGFALVRLENRLDQSLQSALWSRLLALPTSFFRRFSVGDLSSRAMGIQRIQEVISGDLTLALLSLLAAFASLGVLFVYHGLLAALALMLVAVQGGVALWMARRQLDYERWRLEIGGRLNGWVHNLLVGLPKLKAARAERSALAQWAERFARSREIEIGSRRLADVQGLFGEVYACLTIWMLFAAMTATLQQGMSVGELLAVHAAFGQFQAAALGMLGVLPALVGLVPAWERLQPILQTAPEGSQIGLDPVRRDPGPIRGRVELRDVSFSYSTDGPRVLHGVDLRVEAGEMVALVGPSGSGKSTCLRLLLGFEQPDQGGVFFDDADLRTLDLQALRRQFGVVLQHGNPSVGTVFHNIVGTQNVGMDEAWWAAEQAGIADDIRAMPMGMFTMVSQRAASFSGGQRQRLLLARAILRRPRLFFLDEATSALDNSTQEKIVDYLNSVGAGRLVIAHRLSTIRRADRIYVLDGGRVVEEGRFDTLIAQGGLFSRLAARQTL